MDGGKRDQAYQEIKKRIIEGKLKSMDTLSEEALAAELSMSKTPIHQALQKLSEDGFVYIYPRKGTIVGDITVEIIKDVFETRKLIEPYLIRNWFDRISTQWLCSIRKEFIELLSLMKIGITEDLLARATELDFGFHYSITQIMTNRFLNTVVEHALDYSRWINYRSSHANPEYLDVLWKHVEIIDLLLAKNIDVAAQKMYEHLDQSEKESYCYR